MARAYLYHVYHRPALDAAAAWAHTTITVPRVSGIGTETKQVYSLRKDMDQLRADGAAKGIVDASVTSIGKSAENRDLWALKVGKGTGHKVLFTGCHHAREWISVEIPYLVAEYLIQKYTDTPSTDQEKRIKHLLLNRQIWFIPMANPDGHEWTTTTRRNWRTNRKAHAVPAGTISRSPANGGPVSWPAGTYVGVDLNRNYATSSWGAETFDGGWPTTSRDPRDCGANAFGGIWCGLSGSGEPESALIDALIQAQSFRSSITYHSYSQLLLYPDAAAGDDYVQWVGKGMDTLIAEKGNPYTYQSGSTLYATTGDLMDFSYEKVPTRPTYTPELRPPDPPPAGWAFSGLPESEIESCFKENLPAALALINCAGHNAKAGKNTGGFTSGKPKAGATQVVRNCWEVFKGWTV
ncbi:MAG TPA: M14 family zinc carboxypeptidase [Phycisphaerae bacterium]|nr:M14 family zinc carboxypeptidase [Phycisphaerae bacterium]